ncbi:hypothetical protein CEXT_476751 [Caerostris extrusa]|uniref:Uncharacterized protein n=1 Tax=Caerostris extrusa TaxID=172846 RepID=A0AAV4VJJ4_CAEEX|nr:hypothetical protein CEXT_476751 [Caerostris extrusa]
MGREVRLLSANVNTRSWRGFSGRCVAGKLTQRQVVGRNLVTRNNPPQTLSAYRQILLRLCLECCRKKSLCREGLLYDRD